MAKRWTASEMGKKGGHAGKGKQGLSTDQARANVMKRWDKYRSIKSQEEKENSVHDLCTENAVVAK